MTKQLNMATYSQEMCTVVTKEGFRATTLSIFMSQTVLYLEHLEKKSTQTCLHKNFLAIFIFCCINTEIIHEDFSSKMKEMLPLP